MNTVPAPVDQRKLRIKQISTGLCIFLFIVSLAFPVYISLMSVKKPMTMIVTKNVTENVIKTVRIKAPTLAQYSQLHTAYPQTLTCPCSQTSIDYKKFVNIQYTLHEVCNSIFVTSAWISSLTSNGTTFFPNDFRTTSPYSFQALRTFCELSENTIAYDLIELYSNQYVSTSVTPLFLFESKTASRIDQFRSSMTNSFLLSLSMIRDTIQANALLSGLQTNYKQSVQNNNVLSSPNNYQGCSCASSSTCISQSAIYEYPNDTVVFNVPGFYTGCYVIQSLLQSDLQCFYDQTCINALQTYLSSSINVTPLNPLLSSRYFKNSTINDLLNNLMIEQWYLSIAYGSYYDECQPEECTYSFMTAETVEKIEMVETKKDVIYIVALIIGVVGGVITILGLIVPRLVKLIFYGIQK